MFSKQIFGREAQLRGKYARVKNIKFPRGNYQTDSSLRLKPTHAISIASRDQFKPIRIGENLVANYKD